MITGWKLVYYKDTKNNPVYDFINSLDVKAQSKLFRTFDLLSEFGLRLGMPHVKKITGTPLWELRILG